MLKSPSRIARLVASLAFGSAVLSSSAAMAKVSWVVFDADNNQILGQNGAHVQNAPASLAKMMTLYLAFEGLKTGRLHWDDQMPISKNAAAKVRMKLWLKAGQTISVRDAINCMIIISANDAATVMGEYIGGSEMAFGRLMTQRARQLGMKSTFFANPSGLTAKVTQLTTPRDMAVLGMALRHDFPDLYPLFSQRTYTYNGRVLNGHNTLMYRYDGVDGIKTGYTDVSGYNLVSSAIIDGRHLVGAVLGAGSARERDSQMAKVLTLYGKDGKNEAAAKAKPVVVAEAKQDNVADLIDDSQIEQGDGGRYIASAGGAWKIQLGANPTHSGAELLQDKLSPTVNRVAQGLKAEVSASGTKRKVFRVLFGGFKDQASAGRVCTQLKSQDIDCLPVKG